MISYLSSLKLSMQVLGSAAWIPMPELYLWGHMEDKTKGMLQSKKEKKIILRKKDNF